MARTRLRRKEPTPEGQRRWRQARICATCREVYFRRNRSGYWVQRNEGHRAGWVWEEVKQCGRCVPVEKARRILNLLQLPAGTSRAAAPTPEKKQ